MRTVYSIPKHREYLHGGYPSEPFLAEAASRKLFSIMCITAGYRRIDVSEQYKHEIPEIIAKWFEAGLISKGQRGELVGRILLTLAHDLCVIDAWNPWPPHTFSRKIPVVKFLETLIHPDFHDKILDARPQNMEGKTLREAFAGSYIHGTQFIKAGDNTIVTDEAALYAFIRGAFIHGDDYLGGNIIIPILMKDEKLDRWIMSGIFIKTKNRLDPQPVHID
ncbi:hypothetical protein DXG03_002723, partial [Asterophora parasitica]